MFDCKRDCVPPPSTFAIKPQMKIKSSLKKQKHWCQIYLLRDLRVNYKVGGGYKCMGGGVECMDVRVRGGRGWMYGCKSKEGGRVECTDVRVLRVGEGLNVRM